MIRYIIVFDRPVRLGTESFEAIGPFDTTSEAMALWHELNRPPGLIKTIYTPTKKG